MTSRAKGRTQAKGSGSANCSEDLETEFLPDGRRRCEEQGHVVVNGRWIGVRCTNAVKEVEIFDEQGYMGSTWTCGQKGKWKLVD